MFTALLLRTSNKLDIHDVRSLAAFIYPTCSKTSDVGITSPRQGIDLATITRGGRTTEPLDFLHPGGDKVSYDQRGQCSPRILMLLIFDKSRSISGRLRGIKKKKAVRQTAQGANNNSARSTRNAPRRLIGLGMKPSSCFMELKLVFAAEGVCREDCPPTHRQPVGFRSNKNVEGGTHDVFAVAAPFKQSVLILQCDGVDTSREKRWLLAGGA